MSNKHFERWIFLLAQVDLENARNFLSRAAEQNLVSSKSSSSFHRQKSSFFQPELLKQLSDILVAATNNPTARTQAGIQPFFLVHYISS